MQGSALSTEVRAGTDRDEPPCLLYNNVEDGRLPHLPERERTSTGNRWKRRCVAAFAQSCSSPEQDDLVKAILIGSSLALTCLTSTLSTLPATGKKAHGDDRLLMCGVSRETDDHCPLKECTILGDQHVTNFLYNYLLTLYLPFPSLLWSFVTCCWEPGSGYSPKVPCRTRPFLRTTHLFSMPN